MWTWDVAIVACVVVGIFAYSLVVLRKVRPWVTIVGFGGSIVAFFSLMVIITSVKFNAPGEVVLAFDDRSSVRLVSDHKIWCPDDCITLPLQAETSSKVHPITENPKVRGLSYTITTQIRDPQKFVAEMHLGRIAVPSDLKDALLRGHHRSTEYVLYEFNNAHSKELAQFYNPLDEGQRTRLEALLRAHLDEKLASKGIKLDRLVSFSVE